MKTIATMLAVTLFAGSACACSVIMAGKNASTTGRVLVGHNEDDGGEQFVHHWIVPARDHAPGSFLPAEPTCAATVPQVPHTFSFFRTAIKNRKGGLSHGDAFLNEHGVFGASDNAATEPFKDALTTCSEGGIYYNLRRAIAERATSARMAVDIATNLITRWGYAAARGRVYTVADKDEAWTIQVLNGRRFVARRCPDDGVVVVPNCLTIGRLEPGDVVAPCLAEEVAGKPDFDYARTFQGKSRWRQPSDTLRWRHILRLAAGVDVGDAFTYSVKPMHKISPEDIQTALSTHYEGTPDEVKPFRHGIDKQKRYLPVCRLSTLESCICVFGATAAETELRLAPGSPCVNAYRRFRPFSDGIPDELKTPGDPVENLERHLQPMSREEYLAEKRARAAPVGTVVFRPGYSEIVIETNACDTVRVAAEEARDFMGRALGFDVPIVTAPTPSRSALFLGPNRWADAAGVTTNGLARDGFRIRTATNGVYVLGIDDPIVNAHRNRQRGGIWFQNFERATVFGVYDFLERFAGVRFHFSGEQGSVVPWAAQIVVPPTNLVGAPRPSTQRMTPGSTTCASRN